MIDAARRARDYFGVTGLDFRLNRQSRERILLASFFPFALLCAMLINLSLDLFFNRLFAGVTVDGARPDLPPEGWQRVANVTDTLSTVLPYISLASLFLAGISRWSRSEASWMLAIGAVLIMAASAAGAAATAIRAFELDSAEQFDLRIFTWTRWAVTFGILGVGYCFVAYRGLAASQRRQAPTPREQPAEDEGF